MKHVHKPIAADKWLASLPAKRGLDIMEANATGYQYRTNGKLLLALSDPTGTPTGKYAQTVAQSRQAPITGTVTGLKFAVRTVKAFAQANDDRVAIAINGHLDVSATTPEGSTARTYLDGPAYTHTGPDCQLTLVYTQLALALAGLPDTLTFRIHAQSNGARCLALAGSVDGQLREALMTTCN